METDEQTVVPSAGQRPRTGRGQLVVLAAGIGIVLVLAGFIAGRQTAPAVPVPAATQRPAASGVVRGPGDISRGVPLGYARSKEGAVAAAVNFAGVLNSQRLVDRDTYLNAVRAITAPESVAGPTFACSTLMAMSS